MRSAALYVQLAEAFLRDISEGRLRPGDKLPTEDEIVRLRGVSKITVRHALDLLRQRGLIQRYARRGTFVTTPSRMAVWTMASIEDAIRAGADNEKKVLEWRIVRAPARPACLPWPPGARLYRLRGSRSRDGAPLYHTEAYVPLDIGRRLARADLARATLLELIEHELGIPVVGGEEEISATVADRGLARRLDVAVGAPLLVLDLTFFDAAGRPLEYARAWYRADKFKRRNRLGNGRLTSVGETAAGGGGASDGGNVG